MGYVQHYLQTVKGATQMAGLQRSYDLPGLGGAIPPPAGSVERYKQEYNLALREYRRLEQAHPQGGLWTFINASDLRKQLKQWESQMHKMLVKIGDFSEQEVREGFDVGQSQRPF